ncbi:MAG: hypothetical protein LBM08_05655 [Dysgonamonadaceae bacterium]|jgi:hypothetical protein|nr:hypothetical protein [Dysgonamonadaceae bacterium]
MGYDVTYHPISEDEIQEWYFDVLENIEKLDEIAEQYELNESNTDRYKEIIKAGLKVTDDETFDDTHGFYIAIVQGFLRQYFYTRGSAFSFVIDQRDHFETYTKKWQDIVKHKIVNPINNRITQNYSSGVYIPYEKVLKLLRVYKYSVDLEKQYSHKRINVFVKALEYAKNNKLGLLEATEVIEPNVYDLNNSSGYTDFWNCDHEGPLLYREAVEDQLREMKMKMEMEKKNKNDK